MPTTFNKDACSLALVHYADNSHHSCRGPTFEKKICLFGGYVSINAKDACKRVQEKKIITLLVFKISD